MAQLFHNHHSTHSHEGMNEFDVSVTELTEDDPRSVQPKDITITMKPHQLSLLYKCRELESKAIYIKNNGIESAHPHDKITTKMGIIGDKVGSGKSYVMLALLSEPINNDPYESNSVIRSFAGNMVTITIQESRDDIPTSLLVIPHNLVSQWTSYIKTWGKYKHIFINKKNMYDIIEDKLDIKDYNLVVVTSTYYNRFAAYTTENNLKFERVIYDEVDNLNMPGCRNIYANFIWLVSASYGNIIYPRGCTKWEPSLHKYVWYASGITNSGFIKNICHELWQSVPKPLTKLLIVKNQDVFIDKSNYLPPYTKHIIKCKTPRNITVLNGIVDRNVIECLNANDIQGAIAHVNAQNKGTEDNIVDILVQKYTKTLSNHQRLLQYSEECIYDTPLEKEAEIARVRSKIRDVEEKIKMIKERIIAADMCTICFDDLQTKTVTRCCQNSFCFKCINIWLSRSTLCPMCKSVMNSNDIFSVLENGAECIQDTFMTEIDSKAMSEEYDKYKNIKLLLENRKPGSKFLVFSNYDTSFLPLYPILEQLGIQHMYLKGNGNVIKCMIDKYKNTNLDVLLINSRHNGCGLNLENTTDVIMFHKFDTQIEQQVIGRAHRLGRTEPLNIWYFLHANECVASS